MPNQHIEGRSISPSTYNNHKCRCDGCTKAWRDYQRPRIKAWRDKNKSKGQADKTVQITF